MLLPAIVVFLLVATTSGQQLENSSTVTVYLSKPNKGYVGNIEVIPGIKSIATFKGVPYGLPPLGDLRFKVI